MREQKWNTVPRCFSINTSRASPGWDPMVTPLFKASHRNRLVTLMTRILAAALATVLSACAASCSAGGGHPPTARITLAPAYVKVGDAYSTDVAADGSASSDSIDDPRGVLPPAAPPPPSSPLNDLFNKKKG